MWLRGPMHEVVRRPRPRKLHSAILQFQGGRRVLILVPLHRLVIDQVGDIQQHLARIHPFAGNLLRQRKKHPVHLDRQSAGL